MQGNKPLQEWVGGSIISAVSQNLTVVNPSPLPSQGTPSPNSEAVDFSKGNFYQACSQSNGKSIQVI